MSYIVEKRTADAPVDAPWDLVRCTKSWTVAENDAKSIARHGTTSRIVNTGRLDPVVVATYQPPTVALNEEKP